MTPRLASYPTPHLFGTVHYEPDGRLRPDGDTLHLRDPVLLLGGKATRPVDGKLEVTMPGHTRPRVLEMRGDPPSFLTVRLSGIDAPEAHYIANTRPDPSKPAFEMHKSRHRIVCQPHHRPALRYMLRCFGRANGRAVLEIDRDVTDAHGRVLAFAFVGDERAEKHTFLSRELVRRGLAFPFVFESAGDHRAVLLDAGARARSEKLGVWQRYVDGPLEYLRAARPVGDEAEGGDGSGFLNHPMIFRRVVESTQLMRLSLRTALRKYDCFDHVSGDLVPGDEYRRVAVDRRVWARHRG